MARPSFDIVVPTIGRPSLARLLCALDTAGGLSPGRVFVVDDGGRVLRLRKTRLTLTVLDGAGRGPAAARNVGWRASHAEWVVFVDDDVVPDRDWLERLDADVTAAPTDVAGIQGRIRVPLPEDGAPTDWERNVAGLESARWATADMAYRRDVLAEVGGFDERFRRAYREDADLALRVRAAGYRLERGSRGVTHPVGPADRWVSVRLQAGNADDVLLERLHGRDWREPGERRGRRALHLATTLAGLVAVAALAGRRRTVARAGLAGWLAGTAELAWRRIEPGPRTRAEIETMLATSALIPAAATFHYMRGLVRWWDAARLPRGDRPAAVLLDRDGTLVADVPYNGDPVRVEPMPGAREALDRLRAEGVPLAVVSNQSGVARGLLTLDDVDAVNRRIEELLGPLGPVLVCPHGPDDGCECRKPEAGMLRAAAERLRVDPARCAVIGDIGSDVAAAQAVGARAVLVPTERTRPEEIEAAPEVAPDLPSAVDLLLGPNGHVRGTVPRRRSRRA